MDAELITCDILAYVFVLASIILRIIPWLSVAVLITLPRAIDQVRLVSGGADAEAHNRRYDPLGATAIRVRLGAGRRFRAEPFDWLVRARSA